MNIYIYIEIKTASGRLYTRVYRIHFFFACWNFICAKSITPTGISADGYQNPIKTISGNTYRCKLPRMIVERDFQQANQGGSDQGTLRSCGMKLGFNGFRHKSVSEIRTRSVCTNE